MVKSSFYSKGGVAPEDITTIQDYLDQTEALKDQTAAIYDDFDDRYLGSKVSEPSVDNDGDPLRDGALYFNTTSNTMWVYDLGLLQWLEVLGANGADGSLWYSGSGGPSAGVGNTQDFFLSTSSGDVYSKATGSWVVVDNLTGPTGATGATGPAGPQGDAGPTGPTGATGPQGPAGADGKTVLNGTVNPTTEGVDGDFYIRTDTSEIFGPKSSGVWPAGVSLVGPTGATGPEGPTGATGPEGPAGPAGATGPEGPAGPTGAAGADGLDVNWTGAWVTSTSYAVNDAVSRDGSSYICTQAHTSGATDEPGVGASWTSYWDLMAQKGAAGAGSGDMLAATYDPGSIAEQLVGLTATQTLTNKTINTASNTITIVEADISDFGSYQPLDADLTAIGALAGTSGFLKKTAADTWTLDTSTYLTSETYTGTVTSVGMTVPTGLAVSGSPITTSGTLAVTLQAGYSIPTTASQTNWDTAYGWGNHASAGYAAASHTHAIADVTSLQTTLDGKQPLATVLTNTTASFTTALETKLNGIETAADVTDATNVAAAGAVMDGDFGSNGLMTRTGAGTYSVTTAPSGAIVGTTDTQTLTNKTLTNPTIDNFTEAGNSVSGQTAYTVNLSNGTLHLVNTGGNCTITLPSSVSGKSFTVVVEYGGAHTLTFAGGGTIYWAGGTAPTTTSTANAVDIYTFLQDGTGTYGVQAGADF